MAGKKKTENFMKDVASEKEWESLCEYQVIFYFVIKLIIGGLYIIQSILIL